jgi:hypothetical protein
MLTFYTSMAYVQHVVNPNVNVDTSTATFAVMEHVILRAIQSADTLTVDQTIQTWTSRLNPSCLFRLSPAKTIIFADQHGLPQLLGPACLAFVLETPVTSYTWPTGATVSTFPPAPGVSLTDTHFVRLLLGYYAMQSDWIRLREGPHKPGQCSITCLTSWLTQWSLVDQMFPGQGNLVGRVMQLKNDMMSAGPSSVGQFMTSDCWNAAVAELDMTLESIQAGAPFVV